MAAVIEPASKLPSADLLDLRDLGSSDLTDLLQEEIASGAICSIGIFTPRPN